MTKRTFIHIGAPKCGSSAVQTALSAQPRFESDGARLAYAALTPDGALLCGPELADVASRSAYRYAASASAQAIAANGDLDQLAAACAAEGDMLILSSEIWFYEADIFRQTRLLERLGLSATIVAYVRPQADYLNAAWWQWGAWGAHPFDIWIKAKQIQRTYWASILEDWRTVPGVIDVQARLLNAGDVVDDFYALLGARAPKRVRANRSLPGPVLRLMQHHRHLRARPEASAIDFILERHLKLDAPTPWVIKPDLVEHIVKSCAEDNARLRSMLSPAQQTLMDEDARWRDPKAYAEKIAEPPGPVPLDGAEMGALAAALVEALQDAENGQAS